MQNLRYYILPLFYLLLGGSISVALLRRLLQQGDGYWMLLWVPMLMVTVMVTIVGIVNVWVKYRTERDEQAIRLYRGRQLLWLCVRCWCVVMGGLLLGIIFRWVSELLPSDVQPLMDDLCVTFYVVCALLTVAALASIVMGENLAEVRLRTAQQENQLLKSQLNPHFLYNTLNNIDALVWLDQERASAAVTNLSSLMRRITYSSRQDLVPLADEVLTLRQMVELQRLRMTHADSLVLEVPDVVPDLRIAPMLLLPLVENCFKHCGSLDEPSAIVLSLRVVGQRIIFSTDNNLPTPAASADAATTGHHRQQAQHGVGLTVLRRRLQLLYPHRYAFNVKCQEGRYQTSLILSC